MLCRASHGQLDGAYIDGNPAVLTWNLSRREAKAMSLHRQLGRTRGVRERMALRSATEQQVTASSLEAITALKGPIPSTPQAATGSPELQELDDWQ